MLLEENPADARLTAYGPQHNPDWSSFYSDYLAAGQQAHAGFAGFSPHELVETVRQMGAAPVLAHPGALHKFTTGRRIMRLITELAHLGLAGIEAYTSWHQPQQAREYAQRANQLGLAVTTGSDYHGRVCKPGVQLGDPRWTPPCINQLAAHLFNRVNLNPDTSHGLIEQ